MAPAANDHAQLRPARALPKRRRGRRAERVEFQGTRPVRRHLHQERLLGARRVLCGAQLLASRVSCSRASAPGRETRANRAPWHQKAIPTKQIARRERHPRSLATRRCRQRSISTTHRPTHRHPPAAETDRSDEIRTAAATEAGPPIPSHLRSQRCYPLYRRRSLAACLA